MLKCMIPLLLLASLAFSINASDFSEYIYLNESNATLSILNVTDNGNLYELVFINQKPALLFYNGELATEGIEEKLYQMSSAGFLMKQADRQKVVDYLLLYNASRNDGQKWPGKEEYACRQALAYHVKDCYDEKSCNESAKLICAAYAKAIGCNDYMIIYPEDLKFGIASHQTDTIIAEAISKILSMGIENQSEILKNISSSLSKLDQYRKDIETCRFRYPAPGENCPNCYGICPDLILNETNIYKAQEIVNATMAKSSAIADLERTVAIVENETAARIAYKETSRYLHEMEENYLDLKDKKEGMASLVNETMAVVDDKRLSRTLNDLDALGKKIESKISERNTTALDDDIEEYQRLVKVLNITITEDLELYSQALSAKDEANGLLFMIQGMKPSSTNKYAENVTILNNVFSEGLEPSELSDLKVRYAAINEEMRKELETVVKGNVSMQTKALLKNLKQITAPLSYEQRENIKNNMHFYILLSIVATLFFALFVVSLLLSYTSQDWAKLSALALMLIALVLPMIVLSAEEGVKSVNIENVFERIEEIPNVNIVLSPQSSRVEIQMDVCAEKVKKVLEEKGKKINVYKLSSGKCYKNGLLVSDCLESSDGFYLNFNEGSQRVSYFLFYKDELNIYGQENDFKTCAIAKLIK
ncbi:MAG: hypothetical protein QW035_02465 [Candidatus Anstonellales archaeon]